MPADPVPRFASVVLDCDSTLCALEGIEALAAAHHAEVEALTRAAMDGELRLEEVYGRRLELVRPDRERLARLGEAYIAALVPDARETVAALRAHGIDVRILSGGLLPAVRAVARELGLTDDAVAAVDVRHDERGGSAGWEETSPLARAGGKAEQLRAWALPRPVLLVGDGATDLEAAPAVDLFVAFAGVADRPAVTAGAAVVVRAPSLAPVLALALGDAEPAAAWRELWRRGRALLAEGRPPSGAGPRGERDAHGGG